MGWGHRMTGPYPQIGVSSATSAGLAGLRVAERVPSTRPGDDATIEFEILLRTAWDLRVTTCVNDGRRLRHAVRRDDLNNVHVDVPAGDDGVAVHLIAGRRRIVAAPDVHAIFQGRRPVRFDDLLATVAVPDADEDACLGV